MARSCASVVIFRGGRRGGRRAGRGKENEDNGDNERNQSKSNEMQREEQTAAGVKDRLTQAADIGKDMSNSYAAGACAIKSWTLGNLGQPPFNWPRERRFMP